MTQIKEALEWFNDPGGELYKDDAKHQRTIRHILEKLADGHVIVPIDATPDMILAATNFSDGAYHRIYKAMIAAYQEEVR